MKYLLIIFISLLSIIGIAKADEAVIVNDIQISANSGSINSQDNNEGRAQSNVKIITEINGETVVDKEYSKTATTSANIQVESIIKVRDNEIIKEETVVTEEDKKLSLDIKENEGVLDKEFVKENPNIILNNQAVKEPISSKIPPKTQVGIETSNESMIISGVEREAENKVDNAETFKDESEIYLNSSDQNIENESGIAIENEKDNKLVYGIGLGIIVITILILLELKINIWREKLFQ